MKLRTEIEPFNSDQKIELGQKTLTIGSCFSDNIGDKLVTNKIESLVNPFGTVYDPLSIVRLLSWSMKNELPPSDSYVWSDDVCKNLHIHSSFSGQSIDELSLQIRAKVDQSHSALLTANWLIITFGTSFFYRHNDTGNPITNCQKLPEKEFSRSIETLDTLKELYDGFIHDLNSFNPNLKIILTLSPVRHLKDGLLDNNISKSTLRLLSDYLESRYDHIIYYPAYEIMLDDLRDYRFYKEDLIHPTGQAIDYIWNHFGVSFFNESLFAFTEQWKKIQTALDHRPFNANTDAHQKFLKKLLQSLNSIQTLVDVSKEIAQVKGQILK